MADITKLPRPIIRKMKHYQIHFTDHSGNPACIVFLGREDRPLPFLYTAPVYFTYPQISCDAVDAAALYEAAMQGGPYDSEPRIRLDLFFLPGATDDDCMEHYYAEKASRGDVNQHIAAVDKDIRPPPATEVAPRLPGLVDTYQHEINYYRGLIIVCDQLDWTAGERLMRMIPFDPISGPELDELDDPEAGSLPPRWARVVTLVASERGIPSVPRSQDAPVTFGLEIFSMSHSRTHNGLHETWSQAVERSWVNW